MSGLLTETIEAGLTLDAQAVLEAHDEWGRALKLLIIEVTELGERMEEDDQERLLHALQRFIDRVCGP